MTPKGNNVVIDPKPRENVLKSGIIIPDTATLKRHKWGKVVYGNKTVPTGSSVLYMDSKYYSSEGQELVGNDKILYWEC